MTRKEALLKKTRSDLAEIIASPTYTTAHALISAVRRYLRAAGPAGEPLTDELRAALTSPKTTDALASALPHRRRADITRTLLRMYDLGEVASPSPGVWAKKTS